MKGSCSGDDVDGKCLFKSLDVSNAVFPLALVSRPRTGEPAQVEIGGLVPDLASVTDLFGNGYISRSNFLSTLECRTTSARRGTLYSDGSPGCCNPGTSHHL